MVIPTELKIVYQDFEAKAHLLVILTEREIFCQDFEAKALLLVTVDPVYTYYDWFWNPVETLIVKVNKIRSRLLWSNPISTFYSRINNSRYLQTRQMIKLVLQHGFLGISTYLTMKIVIQANTRFPSSLAPRYFFSFSYFASFWQL